MVPALHFVYTSGESAAVTWGSLVLGWGIILGITTVIEVKSVMRVRAEEAARALLEEANDAVTR